jgi:hypothetical protein
MRSKNGHQHSDTTKGRIAEASGDTSKDAQDRDTCRYDHSENSNTKGMNTESAQHIHDNVNGAVTHLEQNQYDQTQLRKPDRLDLHKSL